MSQSQNSQISIQKKELKKLQTQQESLQTEIQQLQSVAQADRQKQQLRKEQFDRDTARLVTEQEETLDGKRKDAQSELDAFEKNITQAEYQLTQIEKQIHSNSSTLISEKADLSAVRSTKDALLIDNDRLLQENSQLKSKNNILSRENNELVDDIASKRLLKAELLNENIEITETNATLKQEIISSRAIWDETIEKYERRKQQIVSEATQARSDYDSLSKKAELVRSDLATRQIAIDAKEKNLKVREYQVNVDEQKIQANAGLLNL